MLKNYIYFIFPVLTICAWVFARKTPVPDDFEESAVTRELYRISLFLYDLIIGKKTMPGADKVRACFTTLHTGKDLRKLEREYYAHKISMVILMAIVGSFLAFLLHYSSVNDQAVEEGGVIKRTAPGEGQQSLFLTATDQDGESLGDYDLVVEERYFTPQEADELFEEASMLMEETVLGDNESFENVTEDLNLVKELEGYPFEISWKTDNYEVLSYDGKLKRQEIPDEGCIVEIEATYKYDDRSWQQVLYVNLVPKTLYGEEKIASEINKMLSKASEETKYEEKLILPEEYEESTILWSQKKEDNSVILMILALVAGGACFVLKDKELKKRMDERSTQLLSDYPRFVSQLVLYLGAGMTLRNVLTRLSDEYTQKRASGGHVRYMYEELARCTRELSAGKGEAEAIESFGRRCAVQEYSRLCALLSQNQRKGNGELLRLLQEESAKAFEIRMDNVKKKGEEAGTKLLFPMILMLLIVMVVIMIPAYMTF